MPDIARMRFSLEIGSTRVLTDLLRDDKLMQRRQGTWPSCSALLKAQRARAVYITKNVPADKDTVSILSLN